MINDLRLVFEIFDVLESRLEVEEESGVLKSINECCVGQSACVSRQSR
jgi:hypothetical protein